MTDPYDMCKKIRGAFGVVATSTGLAMRVKPEALSSTRPVICANDTRFDTYNRAILMKTYSSCQGFRAGAVDHECARVLRELGWTTVPLRTYEKYSMQMS
jgi:hypothetical protein